MIRSNGMKHSEQNAQKELLSQKRSADVESFSHMCNTCSKSACFVCCFMCILDEKMKIRKERFKKRQRDYEKLHNKEQNPDEERKREEFRQLRIPQLFIYTLYLFGFSELIGKGKMKKILSRTAGDSELYNVHHKIPLDFEEGNNSFTNLALIDMQSHDFINKYCLSCEIMNKIKEEESSEKRVALIKAFSPPFNTPLITRDDYFPELIIGAAKAQVFLASKENTSIKRIFSSANILSAFSPRILNNWQFDAKNYDDLIDLYISISKAPDEQKETLQEKINACEQAICNGFTKNKQLVSTLDNWNHSRQCVLMRSKENFINIATEALGETTSRAIAKRLQIVDFALHTTKMIMRA